MTPVPGGFNAKSFSIVPGMIETDRTGAPTEEYLRHLYGDIVDPLEVIESVASTLDDFEKPEWLIKRLIECRTLGQIYAGWNVGKSALAVDIACRVATGLEFAGRKVCQGPVLYVAMEGSRGLKRRFKGWQQLNGQSIPGSLYRTRVSTRLPDPESEAKLESALTYIESKHDRGPLLVIIDTLAQTMIGEQNSTSDVDRFVATLRQLFPDSAVMLLHHAGHFDKHRGRGASSLPAACDWEFRLEDCKAPADTEGIIKTVRLVNTKQRDEELQSDFCFSLIRVVLGEDEDGEALTTVAPKYLLDLIDTPSFSTRWGPNATKMLELLDQLLSEQNEQLEASGDDPSGARVRSDAWRRRCIRADVKTDAFRQAKKRLLEHGEIDIAGDYVTRVKA